jgi:hypothetical protein
MSTPFTKIIYGSNDYTFDSFNDPTITLEQAVDKVLGEHPEASAAVATVHPGGIVTFSIPQVIGQSVRIRHSDK